MTTEIKHVHWISFEIWFRVGSTAEERQSSCKHNHLHQKIAMLIQGFIYGVNKEQGQIQDAECIHLNPCLQMWPRCTLHQSNGSLVISPTEVTYPNWPVDRRSNLISRAVLVHLVDDGYRMYFSQTWASKSTRGWVHIVVTATVGTDLCPLCTRSVGPPHPLVGVVLVVMTSIERQPCVGHLITIIFWQSFLVLSLHHENAHKLMPVSQCKQQLVLVLGLRLYWHLGLLEITRIIRSLGQRKQCTFGKNHW